MKKGQVVIRIFNQVGERNGEQTVAAEFSRSGVLALHRELDAERGWVIAHVQSTCAVAHVRSKIGGLRMMELLDALEWPKLRVDQNGRAVYCRANRELYREVARILEGAKR
jgi:hypothetical protein